VRQLDLVRICTVTTALLALSGFCEEAEVPVHGKFEHAETAEALGTGGAHNPYDPEDVKVDAEIVFPDGTTRTHPCFWYVPCQEYWTEAVGDDKVTPQRWERFKPAERGEWRFRFSPPKEGAYRYSYSIALKDKSARKDGGEFVARPALADAPVPIVRGASSRYFRHADGKPFIPLGHNLGWPIESGATGYSEWVKALADAGGNAGRLWLVHYYGGTALEWSASRQNSGYAGVGKYSQEAAARVDRIIENAAQQKLYLIVSFFSFGDQNWDWRSNPYSKNAKGWLEKPSEFFTDGKARKSVRALLRYAVARWGYAANLWAWELWNEVESSAGYEAQAVTAWKKEMAEWLKQTDIHGRLITTSYRFAPPYTDCEAYASPQIDFVQVHSYHPRLMRTFPAEVSAVWKFGKPVVVAEYGLWVTPNYFEADPVGLHVHDGLWAGVFSGAAGGGMTWWWDKYVHPRDLYFHYTGIARFLKDADFEGAATLTCTVKEMPESYFAFALKTKAGVWGWVGTRRWIMTEGDTANYQVKSYETVQDSARIELDIDGKLDGAWEVVFYDTFDGIAVSKTTAQGSDKGMTIVVPHFRHDLAFKCSPLKENPTPLDVKPPTPIHERFTRLQAAARK
jgi:hypothetical protein